MATKPTVFDKLDQKLFDIIYSRALVYNTCWEDPAVDRAALNLTRKHCSWVDLQAGERPGFLRAAPRLAG